MTLVKLHICKSYHTCWIWSLQKYEEGRKVAIMQSRRPSSLWRHWNAYVETLFFLFFLSFFELFFFLQKIAEDILVIRFNTKKYIEILWIVWCHDEKLHNKNVPLIWLVMETSMSWSKRIKQFRLITSDKCVATSNKTVVLYQSKFYISYVMFFYSFILFYTLTHNGTRFALTLFISLGIK
jgi:hypothetical protein